MRSTPEAIAELQTSNDAKQVKRAVVVLTNVTGEGGIRTLGRDLSPYDGLANR